MNQLLQLVLDAHGGLENWKKIESVQAHAKVGDL